MKKQYCCPGCAEEDEDHKLCYYCRENPRKFWSRLADSQAYEIKITTTCETCFAKINLDDQTILGCCVSKNYLPEKMCEMSEDDPLPT